MSLSVSSLAASDSGAASVDTQSSPVVAGRERGRERRRTRSTSSGTGLGLLRVRSHALFLNDGEVGETGEERIIVPKQISLAAGSPDLQYDMGSCALQGVSSRMEDRVMVYDLSNHPHFSGCRRAVLMAVLDGHAGSGAVSYLEEHLAQHVLEEVANQIGSPPVLEMPQPPQHQRQHVRQNHPVQHPHHSHQHQQKNSRHSQPNLQPCQPPHARQQQQQQQQQQQAATSEAPAQRHSQQQDLVKQQPEQEEPQPAAVPGQQVLQQQQQQQPELLTQMLPQEHERRPELIFTCTTSSTLTLVTGPLKTDSRVIAAAAAPASPTTAAAVAASAAASAAAATVALAAASAAVAASPLTELMEGAGAAAEAAAERGAVPESRLTGTVEAAVRGLAVEASISPVVMPEGSPRMSSSLSLELRTPGPVGTHDWDPADVASSNGLEEWAVDDDDDDGEYDEDEEGLYGDGPWAPPLNHSAAAERRRTSLAANDSGCGCRPPDPPAALRNALLRCERELMDQDCHSGTTALVALMLGGSLWLANVGDCRAVVCDDGEARQLTVDHKAGTGRPDAGEAVFGAALLERQRLLALGVQLSADGYLQVTAPDGSCSDIAVSRNLGCAHLKDRSCSGRGGGWSHLYPPQNQGQHMHMPRRRSRGARLSACSGGSGMRTSTSDAAAAAGASATPGRGGSAGSVEWPQQQHGRQQQPRHHHASAPGSVSGGLDDLSNLRTGAQQQGVHPHSHHHHQHQHQHHHHHHHQQTRNHHTPHGHLQHHHQPTCGASSTLAEGCGTQGQVTHHIEHQIRHHRHSSHTRVDPRQSGSGMGFESRSDPPILTFSPSSIQTCQQQQQLPLQPNLQLVGSANSGLRHHRRDEPKQSLSDISGLKDSCSNHQNVQGAPDGSHLRASYEDGCSVVAKDGSGGTETTMTPLVPHPILPSITTSPVGNAVGQPPPLPPSLAQQHQHQQSELQQQYQGLSPRPPRPPLGSISGSSRVGAGADPHGSPRLQSAPAIPLFSTMTVVSGNGGCSPDQIQPPNSDAAVPGTAATTGGRVPVLQPFIDSGSRPVSRPGSRRGSGTGFTIVQASGGPSGHNLGLPPLPPSSPGGGGTAAGGAAGGRMTVGGLQQHSHHRSSSGGGGGGSGRIRERSLSPALAFCPVLGSGGGYCRLYPLEEGGSSSSGIEGSSPGGMGCGEEVASLMGDRCSMSVAAAPISGGVGRESQTPVMGLAEAATAATAGTNIVAFTAECAPVEDNEKRGHGAVDAVLKTAVTFSSWTLNSTFIRPMPEGLAAAMSAAAVESVVLTPPAPTPGGSSPATSMNAADGSAASGRRISGLFGSGVALSEASAGACSSAAGVLIPDPDLFYYEISEDSEFLICACDGLWDVMRNVDACRYVRRWLADGRSAAGAAEDLCRAALKMGSHDNISVVVLKFSDRPLVRAASSSRLRRAASEAQL